MNQSDYESLKQRITQSSYGNLGGLGNTTNQLGSAPKAQTGGPYKKQYSLAEVQLVGGEMIGMMISAGPALGQHLTKAMASEGYLNLFNDSETLIIKADHVVAIKLTLITTE